MGCFLYCCWFCDRFWTGKLMLFFLISSFTGSEGSGETIQKETSTCDICQFGAECDEDAEDVWYGNMHSLSIYLSWKAWFPLIILFLPNSSPWNVAKVVLFQLWWKTQMCFLSITDSKKFFCFLKKENAEIETNFSHSHLKSDYLSFIYTVLMGWGCKLQTALRLELDTDC